MKRITAIFHFSCLLLPFLFSCTEQQPEPIPVSVKGISIDVTSLQLTEGESAELQATVSPRDADNQTIIWSSSNGSVASVVNGKVTALSPGSSTIVAISDDGGFRTSCEVSVIPRTVAVKNIYLSESSLTLIKGETTILKAVVEPDDATDKVVVWSSSDESIATVNSEGVVSSLKDGEVVITAKAGECMAACSVTVSSIIEFEDSAFKSYCLGKFDDNGDGEISMDEALKITTIWVSSDSITSLKGIEYFPNLVKLSCCGSRGQYAKFKDELICSGQLTSLDVSMNKELKYLDCSVNYISELNLDDNTRLDTLRCGLNKLTSLTVNRMPDLKYLDCSANHITSLDVTHNLNLEYLSCSSDDLTTLKVNLNDALSFLNCSNNSLPELDVSWNKKLTSLLCASNLFSSLYLKNNSKVSYLIVSGCRNLISIFLPDELPSITRDAFDTCDKLPSINLPASIQDIGDFAFSMCTGLSSISIPDKVTRLGRFSFQCCYSIKTIEIPTSVLEIGEGAFSNCKSLESITCLSATPPKGADKMFDNTADCPILVPSGSIETYKKANYWSQYSSRIRPIRK